MISRIAPTPSGYLHAGNCLNFLVTDALVRSRDGSLALRIDDMDADRYRVEYVEDVFRVLDWLGIDWTLGPRDVLDFETSFALRDRTERYRAELATLRASDIQTYACVCSRAQLRAAGSTTCVARCRDQRFELEPHRTALRVHVPAGTAVDVSGRIVKLDQEMGDFVVWRRDDRPAYQLASVVEDRDLGTTHIVRGEDLVASSAAQVFLAGGLQAESVGSATYLHHRLLVDEHGRKLSKSQSRTGPLLLDDQTRESLIAAGNEIVGSLDLA